MKLFYNNFELSTLGTVSLMEEGVQYLPADAPQKQIINLTFRIDVWAKNWTTNRTSIETALTKLQDQNCVLRVVQEAIPGAGGSVEKEIYNQTATIVQHNFPSDINEWGVTRQQVRITFSLTKFIDDSKTNAVALTAYATEGGAGLAVGSVYTWKEQVQVKRYDELHDTRQQSGGFITATGELKGNMASGTTLDARRTALLVTKEALIAKLDNKSVRLAYGTAFDKTVRVTGFECEINQMVTGITWSLSATYTRFPNEAGYVGSEFQLAERKDSESGESFLTLSGSITSDSVDRADAKLILIRTAALAAYTAYGTAQQVRSEKRTDHVAVTSMSGASDVGDQTSVVPATSFIKMSFTEEYKVRTADHLSWNLTVDDQDDLGQGLLRRTYSGSVVCGHQAVTFDPPTTMDAADAAFYIAIGKARELGDGKHNIILSSSIKRDDRLLQRTGNVEMVKVDFSFSYAVRSSRIYAEIKSDLQDNRLGEKTETVSGFVVGGTDADAEAYYADILAGVTGHIRNIQKTVSKIRVSVANAGTLDSPPTLAGIWSYAEGGGGKAELVTRLEFSFQVFHAKASGLSIKYTMGVSMRYQTMEKVTTIDGECYATTAKMNEILQYGVGPGSGGEGLTLFNDMGLGTLLDPEFSVDREYIDGETAAKGLTTKVKFRLTYVAKITGFTGIVDCTVNERIKFSGRRNIEIPVPNAESEFQDMGIVPGRRTVSGTVTAATEAIALAWVKKMSTLAYANTNGIPDAPAVKYAEPPEINIGFEFVPLNEGVPRGAGINVKLAKVDFTFETILPVYAYTP
jgi:hypothetical protein